MKWNFHIKINFNILTRMIYCMWSLPSTPLSAFEKTDDFMEVKGMMDGGLVGVGRGVLTNDLLLTIGG